MHFRSSLFLILLSPFVLSAQEQFIYVSDAGNFAQPPWQILKFNSDGSNGQLFISDELAWPQDIVFLEAVGEVLISNLNSGRITRHDADDGSYIGNFATGIAAPTRMKIGPDGALYVLQWLGNGNVLRYATDGTPMGEFTTVGVSQAIGLDWDANGHLYVSSYNEHSVRRYDQNGNDLGIFIDSGLSGPTNIWFDEQGDLLVINYNGNSVKRFNASGEYVGEFITGLAAAEGVAYTPEGNILIGNGQTSSVKMFDPQGQYITDLIPNGSAGLMKPNAVVLRNTAMAMNEHEERTETTIVTPSVGTEFNIAFMQGSPLIELKLMSLRGELVRELDVKKIAWKMHGIPAGLYVLTATSKDGRKWLQRINVQD